MLKTYYTYLIVHIRLHIMVSDYSLNSVFLHILWWVSVAYTIWVQ